MTQLSSVTVGRASICVVTVTYGDRAHLLAQVLTRLRELESWEAITSIFVVDNGSHEKTKHYLGTIQGDDSRIRVVSLSENCGSAGGFGAGIEAALKTSCTHIWLLDDDNVAEKDALTQLFQAQQTYGFNASLLSLRSDREYLVSYAQGSDESRCFGRPQSFLGFSWKELFWKMNHKLKLRPHQAKPATWVQRTVPFAPYSGLFVPTTHVQKIGLPNTRFYLYCDDFEYTYRLTQEGLSIWLIPESRLADVDQSWFISKQRSKSYFVSPLVLVERQADSEKRIYYSVRNRVFFELTSLHALSLIYLVNLTLYLLMLACMSLSCAFTRFTTAPLMSYRTLIRATYDGFRGRLGHR